jgi:hypothetical protein
MMAPILPHRAGKCTGNYAETMIKLIQVKRAQSPEMRRFPMLQPDEKEKLERGFAEAEASLFLEGLDAHG